MANAIQLVNVQSSSGTTAARAKFTINFGVFLPEIFQRQRIQLPLAGLPRECECTLRIRIGRFMNPPHDHWWTICSRSDVEPAANEIRDIWESAGWDWMERCSKLPSARDEAVRMGELETAVVISIAIGERDMAKQLFQELMKRFSKRRFELLENWGIANGLLDTVP